MSGQAKSDDISAIRADTNRAQAEAADPAGSAWVSANAGTGKTHVLTRRVLRLLLAGTPPERILCLTYTKAAAAEMSTRVFQELGFWVTKPTDDLDQALTDLLGRGPTPSETARARSLFASAIETPGGLKVQTIHAFCERLLQRFPLEAGVAPGFSILDDVMTRQLLRDATDATLREATNLPEAPMGRALTAAVAYAADNNFDDILREAIGKKDWIEHVVREYGHTEGGTPRDAFTAVARDYRNAFGISVHASQATIENELAQVLSDADLMRAADVLSQSGVTDQAIATALRGAISANRIAERIEHLEEAFLTRTRTPRADSRFIAKAVRAENPALAQTMVDARDRFAKLVADRSALDAIEATLALIRIADGVMTHYAQLKARRAALDFEDLIRLSASLLRTSGAAEWVLYKLDGGLDHILVDESQDTSPEQWRIVEALAAEFFSGSGARDTLRTMFAVGDEKQSIYSFQGAQPEQFARMGAHFRASAAAAGVRWRDIPLHLSFRTVAPILESVDLVFADQNRTPGLTADGGRYVRHAANRIGHGGTVEIWETIKPVESDKTDAWSIDGGEDASAPAIQLAERIAETVQQLISGGETLESEGRAITPGDILILLRKRHPFAAPMVSALKSRKIPVAGADRLSLGTQLAVQDLVALGDFLTLPEDDLALANVLKSPLFGFDDEALLQIAYNRRGTLWKALLDKRSDHPAFEAAAALLRDWRRRADFLPPYEFLAGLLDRDGMRERLLSRLGAEASDSIDELLNLAISFDDDAPPSLTGFLASLRESKREIKRDMEHGRDEVRIMTVHGAKGLEAPIVFLPDTCTSGAVGGRRALYHVEMPPAPESQPDAFVWQVKGTRDLAPLSAGRADAAAREAEERNRLLYVAMTRARDRLYVAGFEGKKNRPADSWYDLIMTGLEQRLTPVTLSNGANALRYQTPQTAPAQKPKGKLSKAHEPIPLQAWAARAAPREPQLTMPIAPSRLAPYDVDEAGEPVAWPSTFNAAIPPEDPPAAPPRVQASGNRFLRGTLTHALLEHLPAFPADTWPDAAAAFVLDRGRELPPRVRASIVSETLAVLNSADFGRIFGPDSRAEVAIAAEIPRPSGRGPGLKLNGQIDRLAIDGNTLFIIDYKTNRPPPQDLDGVADTYLFQLAAYRLALAQLFPDKSLRAAILWTDGPRLMEIPAERIAKYEQRLWDLDLTNLDVP